MYTPTRAPSTASRRPQSTSTPRNTPQVAFGRSKSSLGEINRFPNRQISSNGGSNQLNGRSQSRSISRKTSQSSIDLRRVSSSSLSRPIIGGGTQLPSTNLNIKVSIRPRPYDLNRECPWIIDDVNNEIVNDEIGVFNYDHVFAQNDEDEKVYKVVADPVISDCLNGFNGTIFAYGMTGSGKTHSMKFLVEKSINTLFNSNGSSPPKTPIKEDWMINSDVFKQANYKVKHITVSILEIYNEKLIDLLNSDNSINNGRRSSLMPNRTTSDHKIMNDLRIVDDPKFGVKVLNLTEIKTTTSEELVKLIQKGERSRRVDSTDYNERSSRSHLIIQLKVALIDGNSDEIVSLLNFCDLAGSERSTTKSDRRKEGSYINKSLLALGTVIMKLSQISNVNSTSSSSSSLELNHIPYRDSKLTRILQPSLSGGSIVSILCTIHLSENVIGETTNTLRFGLRAKNVLLNVKKSEIELNKDMLSLLRENETLLEEVNHLKMIIDARNVAPISSPFSDVGSSPLSNVGFGNSFGNSDNDKMHEIVAENIVLSEQLEHLKRLQMSRDENGVKSTDMNMKLLHQQIQSIEDPSKRKRFEIVCEGLQADLSNERHKSYELTSYVSHLENKVRMLEIELDTLRETHEDNATLVSNGNLTLGNVSDLEESIRELRVSVERKDAMISALQSANRLQSVVNRTS